MEGLKICGVVFKVHMEKNHVSVKETSLIHSIFQQLPAEVKIGVVDLGLVLILTAVSCGYVVDGFDEKNSRLILDKK